MALHLGGRAPREQTRQARAAVRPDDDEIRLPGTRHLDDLLPRDAVDNEAVPLHPALVHALQGAVQAAPGGVCDQPADAGRHIQRSPGRQIEDSE